MILFIVMQQFVMSLKQNLSISIMLVLVLATVLVGTFGFSYFEHEENEDGTEGDNVDLGTSFYWTMATVTTVGYGDISPASTGGRAIFYLVALMGISTISLALGTFASALVEVSLMKINGMGKTKQKGHIIIVGWNQVTENTYAELEARGEKIVVIDDDDDPVEMKARGVEFIKGRPSENTVLKRGGVEQARVMLIPIESDEETILIALKAKRLNPNLFVVATCDSAENLQTMVNTGIDTVIPQSDIIGTLLGNAVQEWPTVEFVSQILKQSQGVDLESMVLEEKATASELIDPVNQKIIAFKKDGKTQIAFSVNIELKPGDIIYYLDRGKNRERQ